MLTQIQRDSHTDVERATVTCNCISLESRFLHITCHTSYNGNSNGNGNANGCVNDFCLRPKNYATKCNAMHDEDNRLNHQKLTDTTTTQ